ncbi:hypothetical protein Pcinc_014545 [Petrolisthes cinctipes]|uniref:Uncharacterized protein n=1 Tax=Petrolisthes cinctipes TaxID=88211 RepID=A0AAE1FWS8_PETCI|nr:hypothetical protein Pcinc_014545 [Petrolisthes cinctipes]
MLPSVRLSRSWPATYARRRTTTTSTHEHLYNYYNLQLHQAINYTMTAIYNSTTPPRHQLNDDSNPRPCNTNSTTSLRPFQPTTLEFLHFNTSTSTPRFNFTTRYS